MQTMNMTRRGKAFTLIELLVVIAVIGILIGILIPILVHFRERSQRVVCMSNQRQLMIGMLGLAMEQNGKLPLTPRDGPATRSDHMSWIPSTLVKQYGLDLVTFTCPNRGDDYIWDPQPNNTNSHRMRVGYYFLFGRKDQWPGKASSGQASWIPTQYVPAIQSMSKTPAIGDVIEKGTFSTPDGQRKKNSSTSHARSGQKLVFGNQEPQSYGGVGGNVGFFDGSVRWVHQEDMIAYPASSGGAVTGYWPPLPPE